MASSKSKKIKKGIDTVKEELSNMAWKVEIKNSMMNIQLEGVNSKLRKLDTEKDLKAEEKNRTCELKIE